VHLRTATVTALTPMIYLEVNTSALAIATEECLGHFRDALVATVVRRLAAATAIISADGRPAHKGSRPAKLELELMDEAQRRG
jgi:non-specific serine/threonine protein kinase